MIEAIVCRRPASVDLRPSPGSVRKKLQMADVRGAHDAEVAPVERRKLRFAQPLDACQHARVNKPEREVGVLLYERGRSCNLASVGNVYLQTTSPNVAHKSSETIAPGP